MSNNEHPHFVGFIGKMGCGKSTAGAFLNSYYDFYRLHPADPMRQMLKPFMLAMGIPEEKHFYYLEGGGKREAIPGIGKSGTQLLQTIGTEWGRDTVAQDIWWRIQGKVYDRLRSTFKGFYSDSIRFNSEAEFVRQRKGKLIRVVRPDFFNQVSEAVANHVSETEQDGIMADATIYNDGDIPRFQENIRKAMHSLFNPEQATA